MKNVNFNDILMEIINFNRVCNGVCDFRGYMYNFPMKKWLWELFKMLVKRVFPNLISQFRKRDSAMKIFGCHLII